MSKEWAEQVAAAEAAAQRKQDAEALAEQNFDTVRARHESQDTRDAVTQTDEFRDWMQARRETDEAWGAWSMAMDARPAS